MEDVKFSKKRQRTGVHSTLIQCIVSLSSFVKVCIEKVMNIFKQEELVDSEFPNKLLNSSIVLCIEEKAMSLSVFYSSLCAFLGHCAVSMYLCVVCLHFDSAVLCDPFFPKRWQWLFGISVTGPPIYHLESCSVV